MQMPKEAAYNRAAHALIARLPYYNPLRAV
jgi:hypothetical protein